MSRAGYDNSNITSGSIGFTYSTTEDETAKYKATNAQMTNADSKWSAEGLFWKGKDCTISWSAYVPYNSEAVENGALKTAYPWTIAAEQTAVSIKAADFLFASSGSEGTAYSQEGISVAFAHKMSKLTINVSPNSEIGSDVTFGDVILSGCALSTTINLQTGLVAVVDNSTEQTTVSETSQDIKTLKNNNSYECIFVPQKTKSGSFKVTVAVEGGKSYSYTPASSITFASGKAYTLDLKVGRDKITVGTISVNDWGTPDNDGGNLTAGTADDATPTAGE